MKGFWRDRLHEWLGMERALAIMVQIERKVDNMALSIADILAAVQREKTVEDGMVTLLGTISADLKQALANEDPNAIQNVINTIDSNSAVMAAAVTANTVVDPTSGITPPTTGAAQDASGATASGISGDPGASSTIGGAASNPEVGSSPTVGGSASTPSTSTTPTTSGAAA